MVELLEKLKRHPPFSYLDERLYGIIEKSAQIAYYPNDTVLINVGESPEFLYVIIKGHGEAGSEDEIVDVYHPNDTFGGIELLEKRPSEYTYKVTEELICYEIPKETFLLLCEKSTPFKNYFFSTIAERIDLLKEKREFTLMSDMMVARVDESILHKGCIVPSDLDIIEALELMEHDHAGCLIVENDKGYGIVTDTDLRCYILRNREQDLRKVGQIQTYPIITAKKGELLFNILLKMTEHSIKHLPLLDESNRLAGVLELVDLLSFFSNQSHLISVQMEKAKDIDSIVASAKRVTLMVEALHSKGVKSRYIAKLVSEINKKMYTKLFELIVPASWHDKCTLVLLGSEGRSEQILRTDQDNALIFEEGFVPEDDAQIAQHFISVLDQIGFPRCSGEVMVINPQWRKSFGEYKKQIDTWIDQPSYEGFMDLAIFFDSVAVAGNVKLHERLKEHLLQRVNEQRTTLSHFARAIESFESPLGLFSRFVSADKGHKGEIDIKKGALFALIHGIRALALEYGIKETNTTVRIKELNNAGFISKENAAELMEALEVLNTFRLHAQLEKSRKGEEIDNFIRIDTLSKLERDLLKDGLRSVNEFKKLAAHHFHLGMVG